MGMIPGIGGVFNALFCANRRNVIHILRYFGRVPAVAASIRADRNGTQIPADAPQLADEVHAASLSGRHLAVGETLSASLQLGPLAPARADSLATAADIMPLPSATTDYQQPPPAAAVAATASVVGSSIGLGASGAGMVNQPYPSCSTTIAR